MRDIKFKGMDISGSWHVGNVSILIKNVGGINSGTYISNSVGVPFAYDIRPETLSQYTGLKDKNGKEIYEGDILKDLYGHHLKVVFDGASFRAVFGDSLCEVDGSELAGYYPKDITEFFIVSNIYENPELLK